MREFPDEAQIEWFSHGIKGIFGNLERRLAFVSSRVRFSGWDSVEAVAAWLADGFLKREKKLFCVGEEEGDEVKGSAAGVGVGLPLILGAPPISTPTWSVSARHPFLSLLKRTDEWAFIFEKASRIGNIQPRIGMDDWFLNNRNIKLSSYQDISHLASTLSYPFTFLGDAVFITCYLINIRHEPFWPITFSILLFLTQLIYYPSPHVFDAWIR